MPLAIALLCSSTFGDNSSGVAEGTQPGRRYLGMCDEIVVRRVSKDTVGIGDPCELPKEDWAPPPGAQEEDVSKRIVVLRFPTRYGVVVVFCDSAQVEETKAKPIEHWERLQEAW